MIRGESFSRISDFCFWWLWEGGRGWISGAGRVNGDFEGGMKVFVWGIWGGVDGTSGIDCMVLCDLAEGLKGTN